MSRLTIEAKEAIVSRALSRSDVPVQQIAKENNVGYSTLLKWLSLTRQGIPIAALCASISETRSYIKLLSGGMEKENVRYSTCTRKSFSAIGLGRRP